MFLKKLEINGFKSFASKTTLDFSGDFEDGKRHGITAIVGPNGSGKSNIADAMRWVMGEQSMKNLRGKKSEDIIFAGSGKKARLGSASVTLYFDNSDKELPLDFDEVAVSRKIFRSGESEYLINGSRVRLQDITDMLARAGVGKESYTIVTQGMADAVLSSTPTDRRVIIEDAAGVKEYQIKKDRSIRKLESTRENLDKAKSLVSEIGPHLKMLKRQSDKAAQGEDVANNLRAKQTKLFSFLWDNFQREKEKITGEKEEIGRAMMNMQREVDKLTDEIGQESKNQRENTKLAELERKERELRAKLNNLDRELIVSEGRIEIEKEKQKSQIMIEEIRIQRPPVAVGIDLVYVKKNIEEIKNDQEKLIERLARVEKLEELQDLREFARVISQRLFTLKSEIEQGKKTQKNTEEERNDTEGENKNTEKVELKPQINIEDLPEIKILREKITTLRAEIKKIEAELEQIRKDIEQEIAADASSRQKFFDLERQVRLQQEELNKYKDKFNEAKIGLAKIEVREDDLRNQIKEELKTEPEALVKGDEPVEPDQPRVDERSSSQVEAGALYQEISKLKIQFEQIGGIDPMVISEYQETQKRFDFLSEQSVDLEKSIVSLREVIREMEQKVAKEFENTFSEINKEFTKYFRIIFGGGNANLTKIKINKRARINKSEEELDAGNDDSDEAKNYEKENEEIGIDIFACPPGKKITNLSLLSGGERSLTSLALLFAVISHNPPPFSVLDEVEAALDEANSKRFGRIITELSPNTQFVLITHNRETMRQASMLYGVTMGEEGISKLLSVRLDQVGQGGKILQ